MDFILSSKEPKTTENNPANAKLHDLFSCFKASEVLVFENFGEIHEPKKVNVLPANPTNLREDYLYAAMILL